ncbi:hypothetical protein [Natronomonas gomsonensis]|uniref:hypothetical protein n=1 Tax=Natronomonas gomsonensis TaxID=1046043 RepID=UPI0015C0D97F|nr:hypothetical protein [Natronomonas gomsonensis]
MCPHSTESSSTNSTDGERQERARVSVNLTAAEKAEWETLSEAADRPLSSFVKSRVRAGVKKFDAEVAPDEDHAALRRSRDEWRDTAESALTRVEELERGLEATDRGEFTKMLSERDAPLPWSEAVERLRAGVPTRMKQYMAEIPEVHAEVPSGAATARAATVVVTEKEDRSVDNSDDGNTDEGETDAPEYALSWEAER